MHGTSAGRLDDARPVAGTAVLNDVSIVIVSYNCLEQLRPCIEALSPGVEPLTHEVVVVDNNSRDLTCRWISENRPEIRLISNTDNFGFAKACNQGIGASRAKYVLLLNPDTVVESGAIRKLESDIPVPVDREFQLEVAYDGEAVMIYVDGVLHAEMIVE